VIEDYVPDIEIIERNGCYYYSHGDDPFYNEKGENMLEYFQN